MEQPGMDKEQASCTVTLCSSFDEDCFSMTDDQHQMCAKSLPMVCMQSGIVLDEVFEPKDGHCPFEKP